MTRYAAVKSIITRNRNNSGLSKSRLAENKEREISKYLAADVRVSPAMSNRSLPKISWPFLALKLGGANNSVHLCFIADEVRLGTCQTFHRRLFQVGDRIGSRYGSHNKVGDTYKTGT